jgi:hypothetical protein
MTAIVEILVKFYLQSRPGFTGASWDLFPSLSGVKPEIIILKI